MGESALEDGVVLVMDEVSSAFGAALSVELLRKYKAHMMREMAQMIKIVFLLNDGCIKTLKRNVLLMLMFMGLRGHGLAQILVKACPLAQVRSRPVPIKAFVVFDFGVLYYASSAAVAQLDRVLGYEPRGRGFESCQPHHLFISLLHSNRSPLRTLLNESFKSSLV